MAARSRRGSGSSAASARTRSERSARAPLDAERVRVLRTELLAWYAAWHRPLPWRADPEPYRVWISEAMLQQTRVETALPYWRRFLERFPDAPALADASDEDLLAAWSGLGYYRRARALREAARALCERHGGAFPRTRAEALALPGVGPYTAGAVLSIAYDVSEAVVDGNVARVLARWFALESDPASAAGRAELWELAAELVPEAPASGARERGAGPGAWNQAVMELGATVCKPRAPACDACPVAGRCAALAAGRQEELPRRAPRPAPVGVRLEILVAIERERLLLERRSTGGRMAGLWEFPTRELTERGAAPLLFPRAFAAPGLAPAPGTEPWFEVRHAITRHRIRAAVRPGVLRARGPVPEPLRWFEPAELDDLGLTGMARKVRRGLPVR